MSVTIHQTPASYTPSDNPVVWTFSSNQTAQPNFVYIVKVYINNVLVKNEMVFPENGIYAKYDASDWTSNACSLPTISADLVVDANNYCQVKITVVERYGVVPADGANAAASNVTAWKAKMTDDDFIDWDPADYIFGGAAKWITNFPYLQVSPKVRSSGESIRLLMINDNANVTLGIKVYDATGLIASGSYGFVSAAYKFLIVNVSPEVIVGEAIGISQANFDNALYYTIEDTPEMVAFRIDIDRSCVYDTYKRFHFVGNWGSVESYSFGLISRVSGKVSSFGYETAFGEWDGNQYEFNKEQGRNIDYAKIIDKTMVAESDWIKEVVQHWLVDNMYGNPVVYEESASNTLIRRKVMNSSFKHNLQLNDMLFLEKVEIGLPTMTSMIV